jgi:hypothetical protein
VNNVTVADNAKYIREKILLPILDIKERNVILFMHLYSSAPSCAAAIGLEKGDRLKDKKKTAVLGQIYLAALLAKGI